MTQLAIIISQSELERLIEERVQQAVSRISIRQNDNLPEFMTCAQAMQALGVGKTTFHKRYKALKSYHLGKVGVFRKDLPVKISK